MRCLFGKSRLSRSSRIGLIAVLLLSSGPRGDDAWGQIQQAPPYQPPTAGPGSGRPPFGQEPDISQDPMVRHAQEEAARKRNIERQNKLLADSNRIVQLANELSAGVETGGKDPPPPAMSRKAEEIEKLARSVKELMKSE